MSTEARTCGACGALAMPDQAVTVVFVGLVPAAGTTHYFRCSGCGRRFRVPPTFALWMLGGSVAIFAWLIWIAPEIWWLSAGLAAVPLAALLYSIHVLRRNPRVDPGTAATLDRALSDPRIQALLRRRTTNPDAR